MLSLVLPVQSMSSDFEKEHVQEVYEAIATHFSSTRYKRWPVVESFISSIPSGSFGCDFGCGNGKNLQWDSKSGVMTLGMDTCNGLLNICNEKGFEVVSGTVVKDPFRTGVFDFALSIAVIHHLRTEARRIQAIVEMLRVMRNDATGLIFVWAFEDNSSVRRHKKLRILEGGGEQDVMVPWSKKEHGQGQGLISNKKVKVEVEEEPQQQEEKGDSKSSDIKTDVIEAPYGNYSEGGTFERFYHLFRKGELEDIVTKAGGNILKSGFDRDNWYVIFNKK